jgi:O-antigen/teichoic acid export membrane protein
MNFLGSTVTNVAGILILGFLGTANMGYFSIAILASKFLAYFPSSMQQAFEPHIYQKYGETNDILKLRKYLIKPAIAMSLLLPAVLALHYICASFFIRHFLPKYTASIHILLIVLLATFFDFFAPTTIPFITAMNKQRYIVPVYLIGILIVFSLGALFIKMGLGITGMACAFLLVSFFIGAVNFMYALGHYMKDGFKCLLYFMALCAPLCYMVIAIFLIDKLAPVSSDIYSDSMRLIERFGIWFIFSSPLILIASKKTGLFYATRNIGPVSYE